MKRSVIVVLVLGLIAGGMLAAPAEAKKRKKKRVVKVERVAQGNYIAPATIVGNCTQADGIGCMTIAAGSNERYLTAKVTDQHGQPVAISIEADLDGDMQTETSYGAFCGETTEPITIEPGVSLVFWVGRPDIVATTACAPGFASQGTLDVTFSNLP